MSDGIYSALSGAVAQQRALDVVANNVANAGTVGYRADHLAFRAALSRNRGEQGPDALRFVTVAEQTTDDRSGPLEQTNGTLDFALQGDGFFAVDTPEGVRYTRAGAFRLDGEGVVRNATGDSVLVADPADPARPELRLPPDVGQIEVTADGSVHADGEPVARLRIVRFPRGTLEKQGATLYAARGVEPEHAEGVQVLQGYLERSNASPIVAMNDLIGASRSFDAFQRVIQGFRQIDERAARELGSSR